MKRRIRPMLLVVCVSYFAAAAAHAAQSALEKQVDAVFAQWNKPDSPGCTCSVIRNGATVLAKSYGLADLERNVPMTPTSVFYVGSMSKQFTAAAIALLVLDGKISLATDIHTFFPEFRGLGAPVTVDQLIHHTSGIRDHYSLLALQGWKESDSLSNETIVALIAKQRSLNFPPGTGFLYSNANYVLLAEIVKRVSGKSLRDFAQERFFTPLQMTSTQFDDNSSRIVRNRVLSYGSRGHTYFQYYKVMDAYGAGGLLSTVGDLARWDENFYTGKVGGQPLLDMLPRKMKLANGAEPNYGFGLEFGTYRGQSIVAHGGALLGFRAQLMRFPQHRFSVAVLCNLSSINPDMLTRRIADIYLAKELSPLPVQTAIPTPVEASIDPSVFDKYVGDFAFEANPNFVVTFTREGDALFAQATNQSRAQIFPATETEFFYKAVNAQISFHAETDGSVNRITLHQNGDRVARRVVTYVPSTEDLRQYSGKYYSDEVDTTFEVSDKGGNAAMRGRFGERNLKPTNRDRFSYPGGVAAFRRNERGEVVSVSIGGGRAINMVFEKQP